MNLTEHPRLLARLAGALYLIITGCALFAYLYVRGQVILTDDMARTAANFLAHEQLYRLGFAAAVIVVICNLPLGAYPLRAAQGGEPASRLTGPGFHHRVSHARSRQSLQLHRAFVHIQPSGIRQGL